MDRMAQQRFNLANMGWRILAMIVWAPKALSVLFESHRLLLFLT